jgi:hypothetical protein
MLIANGELPIYQLPYNEAATRLESPGKAELPKDREKAC